MHQITEIDDAGKPAALVNEHVLGMDIAMDDLGTERASSRQYLVAESLEHLGAISGPPHRRCR